jgi:hypothetical protein
MGERCHTQNARVQIWYHPFPDLKRQTETFLSIETYKTYTTGQELFQQIFTMESTQCLALGGMVSIRTFGKFRLVQLDCHRYSDEQMNLLAGVIPHALGIVLACCNGFRGSLPANTIRTNPFPPDAIVAETAQLYMGLHDSLMPRREHQFGRKLAELDTYLALKRSLETHDLIEMLEVGLPHIIADICALSLSHSDTGDAALQPLLYSDAQEVCNNVNWHQWVMFVASCLASEDITSFAPFNAIELVSYLMRLLGQWPSPGNARFVASALRGQVVMPNIFLTSDLKSRGYLQFACIPGVLRIGTRRLELVKSEGGTRTLEPEYVAKSRHLLALTNDFVGSHLMWRTTPRVWGLEANMDWSTVIVSDYPEPMNAARHFVDALVTLPCGHDQAHDTKDERHIILEPNLRDLNPTKRDEKLGDKKQYIGLYPVHGSADLALLALCLRERSGARAYGFNSDRFGYIINQGACLDCATRVCKAVGYTHIIL